MITKTITDFDIRQTADSGQCFRLNERQDGSYALVAGGRYLEISQRGGEITFSCTGTEFETLWRSYFDLDTDYAGMKESVDPADDYMRTAISFGGGIRILRQELWETLVTFIISQQNNIPRIKKCVESLCAQFGERRENYRGEPYYTFPSPSVLGRLPDEALDSIHLGYRSKYILKTARMVEEGAVDLSAIQKLKYEEAKAELMKCYGVGVKVAQCRKCLRRRCRGAFQPPGETGSRQGAVSTGDAPPILFLFLTKRECAAPGGREKIAFGRNFARACKVAVRGSA